MSELDLGPAGPAERPSGSPVGDPLGRRIGCLATVVSRSMSSRPKEES